MSNQFQQFRVMAIRAVGNDPMDPGLAPEFIRAIPGSLNARLKVSAVIAPHLANQRENRICVDAGLFGLFEDLPAMFQQGLQFSGERRLVLRDSEQVVALAGNQRFAFRSVQRRKFFLRRFQHAQKLSNIVPSC